MAEFTITKRTRSFVIEATNKKDLQIQLDDFFKTHTNLKVVKMLQTSDTYTIQHTDFTEIILTIIFTIIFEDSINLHD